MKTARYHADSESIELAELLLIAGETFVVTVRHGDASALSDVRRDLEADPDKLRCGPAAVLHAVCDRVVDDYEPVADGLELAVQEVEEEVFSDDRSNPVERIYRLKRQVLVLLRNISPLGAAVEPMVQSRLPHSHPELAEYFRDVADHLKRVTARVDTTREVLTDVLNANLAQISVRQNDDTRAISAWAAVVLVPTLLAGIWGMNFSNMPELEWQFGYPLALGSIVLAAFAVYRTLKRAGWL